MPFLVFGDAPQATASKPIDTSHCPTLQKGQHNKVCFATFRNIVQCEMSIGLLGGTSPNARNDYENTMKRTINTPKLVSYTTQPANLNNNSLQAQQLKRQSNSTCIIHLAESTSWVVQLGLNNSCWSLLNCLLAAWLASCSLKHTSVYYLKFFVTAYYFMIHVVGAWAKPRSRAQRARKKSKCSCKILNTEHAHSIHVIFIAQTRPFHTLFIDTEVMNEPMKLS